MASYDDDEAPIEDDSPVAAKIKKAKDKDPDAHGSYDKGGKPASGKALDDLINQIIDDSQSGDVPEQPSGKKSIKAPVKSDKQAAAAKAKAPPPELQPAIQMADQRANQEAQAAYMAAKIKAANAHNGAVQRTDMQLPPQAAAVRSPQAQQVNRATGVPDYIQQETDAPGVQEPEVSQEAIARQVPYNQASGDAKVRSYIDDAKAKALRRGMQQQPDDISGEPAAQSLHRAFMGGG